MCVHMWEPWEWAGVSGVDVFSPPESEKLYLAHTAWHRGLHHSNQREIPRGMSMRNVEFPELEHTPRPKRRKRESAFAVSKTAQRGPHCVVCAASRCRAVIKTGLRSTMTTARDWERRAGRAGRWWCALWGRVAQPDFEAVPCTCIVFQ